MKEKIIDYLAWAIAKIIKPIYDRRDKIKSKEFLFIIGSILAVFLLTFTFGKSIDKDYKESEIEIIDNSKKETTQLDTQKISENNELEKSPKANNLDIQNLDIQDTNVASLPVYSIVINDSKKIFFKSEKKAKEVLDKLKKKYISKETEKEKVEIIDVYFDESVSIKKDYLKAVDLDKLKTVDQALKYIYKGTDKEKKHVVDSGESFWTIAHDNNISVNNLISANPDIDPKRLQIDQEISLIVPEPLISVCTVENIIYDEKIKYDVEYEKTSSLYKDEYRIKKNGTYGKKEIKAKLVKSNGKELGKVVLAEEVVSKPSTKIVYKGTKDPPPKKGTGVFSKPLNRGTVTSGYGNRIHPIYGYYRKHTGVDIAASYGTTIKSSDGGKVIFAGWKSGYGRVVIIDHGANLTSLYAHMSSINVKTGQKVYKGKTIGKVGSSGTSTGSHVHFEIRKLGDDVNPNNYINLYSIY